MSAYRSPTAARAGYVQTSFSRHQNDLPEELKSTSNRRVALQNVGANPSGTSTSVEQLQSSKAQLAPCRHQDRSGWWAQASIDATKVETASCAAATYLSDHHGT